MIKTTITPRQMFDYIQNGGQKCPFCGSDNIDTGPIHTGADDEVAYGNVGCQNCGHLWTDVWKLKGIDPDNVWKREETDEGRQANPAQG